MMQSPAPEGQMAGLPEPGLLPIVVDLDGTLLQTDTLHESLLLLGRQSRAGLWQALQQLGQGKAAFKDAVVQRAALAVEHLPVNPEVLAYAQEKKQAGHRLILCSASLQTVVAQVAARFPGLFDEIKGTEHGHNLSGRAKRDWLVQRFGERGYVYVGDARPDLAVWSAAAAAVAVNPRPAVLKPLRRLHPDVLVLRSRGPAFRSWRKAIRLTQWSKNFLLFLPLLAAHEAGLTSWGLAVLAWLCFGLCASAIYLLNDLLDLGDDRQHPVKRNRPFASGQLPVWQGLLASPLMMGAGALGAWLISGRLMVVLLAYMTLSTLYSFYLKRLAVIDLIVLAMLYTARIIAGSVATHLPLSFWMLAFSMFLFLGLAIAKRYAELLRLSTRLGGSAAPGRGYVVSDLAGIANMGVAASYIAVLVLALYVNDPMTQHLYREPRLIWLACPILLYWVSRIWMLSHRGQMNEDPVVFALTDKVSLVCGVLFVLVFALAR